MSQESHNETDKACTRAELAQWLGVTARTVTRMGQAGYLHKDKHGRYLLRASVTGYIEHLRALPSETQSKTAEERRLKQAQAELRELDVAERRRDLLDAEAVKQAFLTLAQVFTSGLEGAAPRVARTLGGGAELKRVLGNEFDRIRADIADRLGNVGRDMGLSVPGSDATAGPKRSRVGAKKPKARNRGR